mmetsp:Transcript_5866/g.15079  ORF Transcript_5866/g.15079 Transcript_5866/m.15079 type:complete len:329 (-) Transcript_5866:222-1208(-)
MAQRRNHYGEGFHAGGGSASGYSGYDASYSAGPAQHAFPSYSPKSGGIKGNKGKSRMPGAAGVLAVALGVSVLVLIYLFSRGNTLAAKLATVEKDSKDLRKKLSKAEMDYKSADKLRMLNEERAVQLDKTEQKLRDERTSSSSYQRKVKELTEQLEASKASNKELSRELADMQDMHAGNQEDFKALQGERERAKRMESFWEAKESEWTQNKKILELDLELAKANIERLENQLRKERQEGNRAQEERAAVAAPAEKGAPSEAADVKQPLSGDPGLSSGAPAVPQDPVDPEFHADAEGGQVPAAGAAADAVGEQQAEAGALRLEQGEVAR